MINDQLAFFNRCIGKVIVADVIRMTSNEMFGFGLISCPSVQSICDTLDVFLTLGVPSSLEIINSAPFGASFLQYRFCNFQRSIITDCIFRVEMDSI